MTPAAPIPAPLEANDAQRARALRARIRNRVSDVRRHLLALRTAMAEFGEDFELDAFRTAYVSEDPVELNRVKAVERGVDYAGSTPNAMDSAGPRRMETSCARSPSGVSVASRISTVAHTSAHAWATKAHRRSSSPS